jgi:hypothetical protein
MYETYVTKTRSVFEDIDLLLDRITFWSRDLYLAYHMGHVIFAWHTISRYFNSNNPIMINSVHI